MDIFTLNHGKAANTSCQLYLFGATLTSWKVEGEELIFVSTKAKLDGTKAIRGGIPICFPAFGAWEFGPQHGFARSSKDWKVAEGIKVDEATGDASIVLQLQDTEETRKAWNKVFSLKIKVTLEKSALKLAAVIDNPADDELAAQFCFHTYFNVPDVTKCKVETFKGVQFIDKTEKDFPTKTEDRDSVTIDDFTDRVYKGAPDECLLSGFANDRKIKLHKTNNFSDYVVWNPWSVNKLGDLGDEDYKNMICVEAAAFTQGIKVPPKGSWTGVQTFTLVSKL